MSLQLIYASSIYIDGVYLYVQKREEGLLVRKRFLRKVKQTQASLLNHSLPFKIKRDLSPVGCID
jgi:hypothetical protein